MLCTFHLNPQDTFSVQAATERGARVTFQPNSAELVYKDGTKFNVEKHGRLYYLSTYHIIDSDSVSYARDLKDWHEILGHFNYEDLMKLEHVVDCMKFSHTNTSRPGDCEICVKRKLTQSRNRKPDLRATEPLELVHTDLAGSVDPFSREG